MDPYTPVRPRRSPRERLYRKQSWLGDTSVDEAGSSAEHSPSPAACSERRDDHLPAASTSVHVNDGAPSDALQPPEYPPLRETSSVQGPGTSSAPTHSCDMTNEVTPDEVMATGARGARCDPADCIPAHASVVRTGLCQSRMIFFVSILTYQGRTLVLLTTVERDLVEVESVSHRQTYISRYRRVSTTTIREVYASNRACRPSTERLLRTRVMDSLPGRGGPIAFE